MERRPTDALWGVGPKTARRLATVGILTVGELASADPEEVARTFGPTTGPWLIALGRGEDRSRVVAEHGPARSRGREETFQEDLADTERIRRETRRLARRVAEDLAEDGRPAVRVVVKVRFAPFFTHTHGAPRPAPSRDPGDLERAALDALERFDLDRPVRLLGVRAELRR